MALLLGATREWQMTDDKFGQEKRSAPPNITWPEAAVPEGGSKAVATGSA